MTMKEAGMPGTDRPLERQIDQCKVFVHIPTNDGHYWRNEIRRFTRVPQVGEYVSLGTTEDWHKVVVVLHCAFDDAELDAEIYTESKGVRGSADFDPPLVER